MRACLLAVLLLVGPRAAAQEAARPVLRELRLEGATVFGPEQVTRTLRVETGRPLFQPPERLALVLERRYHDEGYLAARVTGAWDEAAGRLVLVVDEGRLARVTFPGLGPAAEARAVRGAALEPAALLREADIEAGLRRLEDDSEGALRGGDFALEREDGGARLELRPETPVAGWSWAPHGPHTGGWYNRVDGWALGLTGGLRLHDRRRYEHLRLEAAVSRSLAAEAWRHAVSLARPVLDRRLELGYEHHDLTDRDDALRLYGLDEAPGSSLLEQSHSDFYRRRGHEAWAFWRAHPRWQAGLSFRADRHESLPLATDGNPFGDAAPRANPPVDEGAAHSLLLTVRASTGELYGSREAERGSFRLRSLLGALHEPPDGLRLEATLERASAEALGGDLTFTRLTASLRGRQALGAGLRADARALAQVGDAGLPSQKRLTLSGQGLLRGYPDGLFRAGDALLLTGELSWAAAGPWPRLLAFYDGGQGWELEGASGPSSGWRQDGGLGLRWPPEAAALFVRVELARPLGDQAYGAWRTLWRLQVPF